MRSGAKPATRRVFQAPRRSSKVGAFVQEHFIRCGQTLATGAGFAAAYVTCCETWKFANVVREKAGGTMRVAVTRCEGTSSPAASASSERVRNGDGVGIELFWPVCVRPGRVGHVRVTRLGGLPLKREPGVPRSSVPVGGRAARRMQVLSSAEYGHAAALPPPSAAEVQAFATSPGRMGTPPPHCGGTDAGERLLPLELNPEHN